MDSFASFEIQKFIARRDDKPATDVRRERPVG
jgi:hypothetical protein